MRKSLFILLTVGIAVACQQKDASQQNNTAVETAYDSFGEKIDDAQAEPVISLTSMASDSAYTKVRGTIVEVCQAKGCWMKLDLGNNETMRVTFKDYGFFVPKDSKGKEVVIEGIAMRKVTPVDELRHYAEDAGKSAEEVAAITEPAQELAFEAVGVLLK